MMDVVSRQGRETQRYTAGGGRRVVGCIPYRFKIDKARDNDNDEAVEVLVISSQKGHGMMFPKGGWENDESITEAAAREAMEEAGVQGNVEGNRLGSLHRDGGIDIKGRKTEDVLDKWTYRSRRYGIFYEATMFPLNVNQELANWPEMKVRKRRWVTVAEAMEGCEHPWMKEALQSLVNRLSSLSLQETSSATENALFVHRR